MIYLIITASLQTSHVITSNYTEDRLRRYHYAIQSSVSHLHDMNDLQPIIVENNGKRSTPLENIPWKSGFIPVIYTTNNDRTYHNKGVNELLDIQQVIQELGIKDDDIIIKLTGRYRLLSSSIVDHIRNTEKNCDVWMKFYNVSSMEYDDNDCVLGLYGIRALYLQWLSWMWLNLFDSPEKGMARYVRQSVPRLCSIDHLDVECVFSENGRVLKV